MALASLSKPSVKTWVAAAGARVAACIALLATGLIVGVSPAHAGKGIAYTFDGPTGFENPNGVAHNDAGTSDPRDGYVYVVSETQHRIEVFDEDYEFQFMFGGGVNATTGGNLCPVNPSDVCRGGDDVSGLGGYLDGPQGIAIDQSDGAVYVMDEDNARVQKYDRNGSFLWAVGNNVNADSLPTPDLCLAGDVCQAGTNDTAENGFTINSVGHLAVDPAPPHDVFVADEDHHRVQVFGTDGLFAYMFGRGVNGSPTAQVCVSACSNGASGTGVGEFNLPLDVGIGDDGDVYVVDRAGSGRVQRFEAPETSVIAPDVAVFGPSVLSGAPTLGWIDVDNASTVPAEADDTIYAERPDSGGEWEVREVASATGTATDVHGDGAGLSLTAAGTTPGGGLAYDADRDRLLISQDNTPDDVMVLDDVLPPSATLGLSGATAHTAEIAAIVNPNGPEGKFGVRTSYKIDISKDGIIYQPVVPTTDIGNGTAPVSGATTARGLEADTTYTVRLTVTKQFSQAITVTQSFDTAPSGPDVDAVYTSDRQPQSATLRARVNPNGAATTYQFEYGLTAAYGTVVPLAPASAGSGSTSGEVTHPVSGLQPGRTYHFRVTATSVNGTTRSADHVFATPDGLESGFGNRQHELVSPPDKASGAGVGGYDHGDVGVMPTPMAGDGERFVSGTYQGGVLLPDGKGIYGNDYAFGTRTPTGWGHRTPFTHVDRGSTQNIQLNLNAFSEDLSTFVMTSSAQPQRLFPGQAALGWPHDVSIPWVLDWGARWEPFNTDWSAQGSPGTLSGNPVVSASGTHIAFNPDASFCCLEGIADPSQDQVDGARTVYIHDVSEGVSDAFPGTGVRTLVNVCTGSGVARTTIPVRTADGKLGEQPCPLPQPGRTAALISPAGAGYMDRPNMISADGRRTFFMSPDPANTSPTPTSCSGSGSTTMCPPQLYLREQRADGSAATRWISRPEVNGQQATLWGAGVNVPYSNGVVYEGASRTGDKVFFRTNTPLTADDPNGGAQVPGGVKSGTANVNSWDLYEYDFTDDVSDDPGNGELTRISAGPLGDADPNVNMGTGSPGAALRFVSESGERVYFTTASPIPGVGGAENATITNPAGTPTTTSTVNLYVYDATEPVAERWTFVALLPRSLSAISSCASASGQSGETLAALSQEGNVFDNLTTTTGGVNCFRGTRDGTFVTFFTDGALLATDSVSGSGDIYGYDAGTGELVLLTQPQGGAGGTYRCVGAEGVVVVACNGDPGFGNSSPRQERRVGVAWAAAAGDRLAFFQSKSRLVAEDTDDTYDVYEWRNGKLALISTGAEGKGAYFTGNSSDGEDVFFQTRSALTWQDVDAVMDDYDARAGGGISQPGAPPAPCDVLAGGCAGAADGIGLPASPQTGGTAAQGGQTTKVRAVLSVGSISRRARARAATTGVLGVRVGSTAPGRITVVARGGKPGARARQVGRATVILKQAGSRAVKVRLNGSARRILRAGKRLRIVVAVRSPGQRSRAITATLKRSER